MILLLYGPIFVPVVCLRPPRVFEKSKKHPQYFTVHIFTSVPLLRTTFPPFSRLFWDAPAHPERTGAALGSSKVNTDLACLRRRLRGPSGEPRPT